jgi:hypothetical protein
LDRPLDPEAKVHRSSSVKPSTYTGELYIAGASVRVYSLVDRCVPHRRGSNPESRTRSGVLLLLPGLFSSAR